MSTVDGNVILHLDFNRDDMLPDKPLNKESCTELKNCPSSPKYLSSCRETLSPDTTYVDVQEEEDKDHKTPNKNAPISPTNTNINIHIGDEISVGNFSNASSPRSNIMEDQMSQFSDSAYGSLTSNDSRYNPEVRRWRELPRLVMDAGDARRIDVRPSPQVRLVVSRRDMRMEEEPASRGIRDRTEVKCFLSAVLCLQILIASFLIIGHFANSENSESDMIVSAVILFCMMCFAVWKFQHYLVKLCIKSREEGTSAPNSPAQ